MHQPYNDGPTPFPRNLKSMLRMRLEGHSAPFPMPVVARTPIVERNIETSGLRENSVLRVPEPNHADHEVALQAKRNAERRHARNRRS